MNPSGPYLGAYQFLQSTWNVTASHAGRPDLVGVPRQRGVGLRPGRDGVGAVPVAGQGPVGRQLLSRSAHEAIPLRRPGRRPRLRSISVEVDLLALADTARVSATVSSSRRSWVTTSSVPSYDRERLLELLDGRQVEVVGRLVEHEAVHALRREPGEHGAGALAG